MSNPLPPNPCLVAIILVVKTTSEPYIAFHYPPRPGEDNSHFKDIFKDRSTFDESTTSSSDDESEDSTAETLNPAQHKPEKETGDSPPDVEAGSASPQKDNGFYMGQKKLQWNDLFGLPAGVLARLLCPAASSHKKKFEVGIKDQVFAGRPMFAREDGAWRRNSKERRSSSRSNTTAEKARRERQEMTAKKLRNSTIDEEDSEALIRDTATETASDTNGDDEQAVSDGVSASVKVPKTSKIPEDSKMAASKFEHLLSMFHVVFVLKPPPLEYHIRVGEMHGKVVKKFAKALKLEQARTNFVAKEAALIASLTRKINNTSTGSSLDACASNG